MASTNNEFVEPWTLDQLVSQRDEIILYEDESYLVINKPADLRMDGLHRVTVHKLLLTWYPTESMNEMAEEVRKDFILGLSKWSDVKDNQLRACHQLDYATSGVLLFAKSREAAAAAGHSFEARLAQKSYLAVVHGHIKHEQVPLLESNNNPLALWENGLEKNYRKKRRKQNTRKSNCFKGYLPLHAVFESWKGRTRSRLSKKTSENRFRSKPIRESSVFDSCTLAALEPGERNRLLSMKWAEVKTNDKYRRIFEHLAETYNNEKKKLSTLLEDFNATNIVTTPKQKDSNNVNINEGDEEKNGKFYLTLAAKCQ